METNTVEKSNIILDTTVVASKKSSHKSNKPTSDINNAMLAVRVGIKLDDYPDIEVPYMDKPTYKAKSADFLDLVEVRVDEKNVRPVLTKTLKEIASEVKKGIRAIRGYLFEKYEDNKKAISFYKDFGLEKKGKVWLLPTDQQHLLSAFKTIKKGLLTHGFGTKKFGTAKFTQLETAYEITLNSAIATDGTSSMTVSQKETLKKEINMYLTSVRFIVRAHYPDTYMSVLRDLGFQKEKA
jgi:hypothetical protein